MMDTLANVERERGDMAVIFVHITVSFVCVVGIAIRHSAYKITRFPVTLPPNLVAVAVGPYHTSLAMGPHPISNDEIELELEDLIRVYKDGRFERLSGEDVTPAGYDQATGVSSKDVQIQFDPLVSARLYLPATHDRESKLPVLVYYHGGGFIVESTASPRYHSHMNDLAARAGILIVSVEYRRVPDHLLPAAFDDALLGLRWVASGADAWVAERGDLGRLFLGGDSSGSTLAHETAVCCQRQGLGIQIEGLLLMHPYFWGSVPVGSETTDPAKRFLDGAIWQYCYPERKDLDDPLINPLAGGPEALAESLGCCRRVLVCVAEHDSLVERGRVYYETLKGSRWGGEVEFVVSKDEDHGFHLIDPTVAAAEQVMQILVAFFNKDSKKVA